MKLNGHTLKTIGVRLLVHGLGWLAYSLITLGANIRLLHPVQLVDVLKVNLLAIPVFYWLVWVFERMFSGRRWWLSPVLLVAGFPAVLLVGYAHVYGLLPAIGVTLFRDDVSFSWREFSIVMLINYIHVSVYAVIYALHRREKRLLKEKLRVERERNKINEEFLRWQINPHFLHNVMNRLLANATMRHDDELVRMMTRFAELQRYSTEMADGGNALVDISRELAQVENLVAMINDQYDEGPVIILRIHGQAFGQVIPPLLLLTFVDNILKYGVLSPIDPASVDVNLKPGCLLYQSRNRIGTRLLTSGGSGVGMDNAQRRLTQLLPGQHTLEVKQEGGYYGLTLQINYNQS